MKQLKFLMAALLMVMGVTLSSCLDSGNDNPIQSGYGVCRFEGGLYGGGVFKASNGDIYEPSDPLLTMGLSSNKLYLIYFTYDINDLVKDKPLKITLSTTPQDVTGPDVVPVEEASEANAPMYALYEEDMYHNKYGASMFDKYTLVVPVYFLVKKMSTNEDFVNELKKHRFEIAYDEVKEGVLNLYLNHVITGEGEETTFTNYTKFFNAYDLENIISDAINNGSAINKIILHAKVNNESNSLKDATDQTFEIDYTTVK